MKVMLLMPLLAACTTIPKAAYVRGPNEPEPRVIVHTPTATVPYQWTEERLILNNEHDDLITADGRRIAGAP